MRKPLVLIVASLLIAIVAVSGCSPKSAEKGGSPAAPSQSARKAPVKGGTLTIAIPGQVVSIDPHKQWDTNSMGALLNMVDTLMLPGPDNKLRPLLAESWTASEDAKTFTFKKRECAQFTDT